MSGSILFPYLPHDRRGNTGGTGDGFDLFFSVRGDVMIKRNTDFGRQMRPHSSMDRVSAFEAEGGGSTPPGGTTLSVVLVFRKIRTYFKENC